MYKLTSVKSLSESQKSRLRNGHPVRVSAGSGNKLHLSDMQIKKLAKAAQSGKGITIQFDPHQTTSHGSGIFGDIATKAKAFVKKHKLQPMINPIIKGVKSRAHAGVNKLASMAHSKIDTVEPIGQGLKKRRGRPRKTGSGLIGDISGLISKGADVLGVGLKKRGRKPGVKKVGKGIISSLAKTAAKALAPVVVDAASSFVKNKIAGSGKRKAGRPKKTTTAKKPKAKKPAKKAPAKKRATKKGTALKPAGY